MRRTTALFILSLCLVLAGPVGAQDAKPAAAPASAPASGKAAGAEQVVTLPSGLKYIDQVVGKGANPVQGQTVVVHYTGWLSKDGQTGAKFDSSKDRNEEFRFPIGVGKVIKGWDEGVASMKPGGKRRLIVPPSLGYGDRDLSPQIPPNSTLIFDVELLRVE